MNFLINLIAGAFLSLATLLSPTIAVQAPAQSLGGVASFNPVQSAPAYLSGAGVSGSATSIPLTNFVTRQLTPITTANIGGIGYATIDPGTSKEENISFTGVTQNSNGTAILTGVVRGLQDVYPYTGTSTLAIAHSGGATVITSNSGAFYSQFNIAANSSTITGAWTFASSSLPNVTTDTTNVQVASNIYNLSTVAYANSLAIGGGVPATNGVPGIQFQATTSQLQASTQSGSYNTQTYPYAVNAGSVASTSRANSIPLTNASGTLDPSFISTSTNYGFGNQTLNGTTTITNLAPFSTFQVGSSNALSPNSPQVASGTVLAYFGYTGATTTYTVPNGISQITFFAAGAYSGDAANGLGGEASGTLAVTPGQQFTIAVGGAPNGTTGGYNGGGSSSGINTGAGGGGMTDVQAYNSTCSTSSIIIAAAGGGGDGYTLGTAGKGGAGGGATGNSGTQGSGTATVGGGGSQSSGGSAGTGGGGNGSAGTACQGGTGGNSGFNFGGGGGGGGYFGGGGGGANTATNGGAGGGGGSSFGTSTLTGYATTLGVNATSGWLYVINGSSASYTLPTSTLAVGGIIKTGGLPISLSSCGGTINTSTSTVGIAATSSGNQTAGVIQIGTATNACTGTFAQPYPSSSYSGLSCTANVENGTNIALGVATTLSTFTINAASTLATSTKINFICLPF